MSCHKARSSISTTWQAVGEHDSLRQAELSISRWSLVARTLAGSISVQRHHAAWSGGPLALKNPTHRAQLLLQQLAARLGGRCDDGQHARALLTRTRRRPRLQEMLGLTVSVQIPFGMQRVPLTHAVAADIA